MQNKPVPWRERFAGIAAWQAGVHRMPRRHPRRIGLLCLIDLVQDADLILPVAQRARDRRGYEVHIIMTEWLDRVAPTIRTRVTNAGFDPTRCSRHALAGLNLSGWDALIVASESTAAPHRFAYALTRHANASGLTTFTMQHGLENLGLTYRGDGDHDFGSQWIFTWGDPSTLPKWVDEGVRRRCIGTGRPESIPARPRPLPLQSDARPLVGIFENLHWKRYNEHFRQRFLADLLTTSKSRPDALFLVRPHPAGRYLTGTHVLPAPDNLIIADPTHSAWADIATGDVLARTHAVITTPSTIALDAAIRDMPVAVVAYGLDLPVYAPLPLLNAAADWDAFLEQAKSGDDRVRRFRQGRYLEGDAIATMLESIAARTVPGGRASAPTLRERATAKVVRAVRAMPAPISQFAPSPAQAGYAPSRALYRRWIKAYDTLNTEDHSAIRLTCAAWGERLLVSVIVDARAKAPKEIGHTLRALETQLLPQHEVIVCAGSETLQSALGAVRAPLVALIAAGDSLPPHALYALVTLHRETPTLLFAYSDEDKIDERGRHAPHFKPDWSTEYSRARDYACRLALLDANVARSCGGFGDGPTWMALQELQRRMRAATPHRPVLHAPFVLYHRRTQPGASEHAPTRVRHSAPAPLISLIVPTRDRLSLLQRCIEGLRHETDYPSLEIIIVDNGSEEAATHAYLDSARGDPRVRVLRDDGPFNFSRLNNLAAREARGALIGLINNDIAVIAPDWLTEMAVLAQQDRVGAVGAMLYYPDGTIQHAGCVLGIGGVAGHVYKGLPADTPGHGGRLLVAHELSAVTAACLLSPRAAWEAVGGLDEDLPVGYNDIDYCLRLGDAGYRILWTPHARLEHHESASRGHDEHGARRARLERDKAAMRARWGARLSNDPYYNPNLTLAGADAGLAFPPRALRPWRKH